MKLTIEAECRSCSGTGLYQGFAEPAETAVVCHTCGGTGCQKINYKPFVKIKRKRGIKWVLGDGGLWFARTGNEPKISIQEFYKRVEESARSGR